MEVYSVQNYLELVTGNIYTAKGNNDIALIEQILEDEVYSDEEIKTLNAALSANRIITEITVQ